MNIKPTQEINFCDRKDEDIAPVAVSRSGQYMPIFGLICKYAYIVDMVHVSQQKTYFVCYSLPNAPVWASAIFPDHFIPANHD